MYNNVIFLNVVTQGTHVYHGIRRQHRFLRTTPSTTTTCGTGPTDASRDDDDHGTVRRCSGLRDFDRRAPNGCANNGVRSATSWSRPPNRTDVRFRRPRSVCKLGSTVLFIGWARYIISNDIILYVCILDRFFANSLK